MIQTLIISKDRPAQLHLLLESIYKNSGNEYKIKVIYRSSTHEIDKGYTILQEHFLGRNHNSLSSPISWIKTEDIKSDILNCIELNHEYTCLFVDDNIVYDRLPTYREIKDLFSLHNLFSLSLKIGNNTIIQDPYSFYRSEYFADIPSSGEFELDRFLVWDATKIKPYTLFATPISFDGHIYKSPTIKQVIEETSFEDVSELEESAQSNLYKSGFSFVPAYKMACPEYSIVIKNTIDKVTDIPKSNFDCFIDGLNSRYITGYRIDYDYYNFNSISMPYERFLTKFVK